jgi:hypothetical protein
MGTDEWETEKNGMCFHLRSVSPVLIAPAVQRAPNPSTEGIAFHLLFVSPHSPVARRAPVLIALAVQRATNVATQGFWF